MTIVESDRAPATVTALLDWGEQLMKSRNFGAAQIKARLAMLLAPDDPRCSKLAFRTLAATRMFQEAAGVGARCLCLSPGDGRMRLGQMRVWFSAGLFTQAAGVAELILRSERAQAPLSTEVLFDVARVLRRVGRDDEAKVVFDKVLARDGSLAWKHRIVELTARIDQFELR